ncbi:hypothetical protein [Commensalibacter nepenthis]|uniref:Uncharacterized protein n=1 Tax=Commensalibacter nepenthis TaxID=3043872 RepID=A0ABT6Q5C2_9PROT|nr:hypothetical protein [Commensalibacter sp. TBRC 10068]MDI2112099.1 hypothetical protein [Commensalibacter sp. TBRC 10068]
MADIKVKTTKNKSASEKKTVKVQKLKASDKVSAAVEDTIDDDIQSDETECLLRSALNITKNCHVQEDEDQEITGNSDSFEPVDRVITTELHNRIFDNDNSGQIIEEDHQNYVVIGCRFPNGVVISLGKHKVLLRGINDMPIKEKETTCGDVGFTRITRSLWNKFLKTHESWPPLSKGLVFIMNGKD